MFPFNRRETYLLATEPAAPTRSPCGLDPRSHGGLRPPARWEPRDNMPAARPPDQPARATPSRRFSAKPQTAAAREYLHQSLRRKYSRRMRQKHCKPCLPVRAPAPRAVKRSLTAQRPGRSQRVAHSHPSCPGCGRSRPPRGPAAKPCRSRRSILRPLRTTARRSYSAR